MIVVLAMLSGLWVSVFDGQQTAPPQSIKNPDSEISTRISDETIKVQVNLVLVRAVVKDAAGNAVPDLKQQDFQVFDNGKPQKISSFNVQTTLEGGTSMPSPEAKAEGAALGKEVKTETQPSAVKAPVMPKRFVALVFDDLHLKVAESMAVHAATEKLFATLTPTDRVAIYSTGGDVQQDFTGDPATLRRTLAAIVPHTSRDEGHHECPEMSYYEADLIENHRDHQALQIANADAIVNGCNSRGVTPSASDESASDEALARNFEALARRVLWEGDGQTEQTYQYLTDVVRKLAGMKGQRVLVYVSPGFLVGQAVFGSSWDWIEKAVRAGVVVNTIDARGLYTPEGLGNIDAPPQTFVDREDVLPDEAMDYQKIEGQYRLQAQFDSGQVLAGMAASTGGTYFHNRNDLNVGLSQALAAPTVSYILGFSPQDAIADGKFHKLKVEVANGKYQIQARNGYFARKKLADPEEEAKQEVREELFSGEEIVTLPIQLNTQFLNIDAASSQLTVLTHLDINGIRFRKADGRNRNDIVLATGVFDSNGLLVDGQMKEVALKLQDSTVKRLSQSGLTFKTVFKVKPGTYIVRSVLRGSEGDQLTARNVTTVIP